MAARPARRPAVFLDRDGTINEELDYLADPDRLALYPGAAEAIAALNAAGLPVVVITNQSGVARGRLDEETLARIHAALRERLAAAGARVDLILYCPHHPELGGERYRRDCACRKPRPGMLEEAARRLDLDLARSWVVGDSARDLEAGAAVGARGILVATGKGADEYERLSAAGRAPERAADLAAAVRSILAAAGSPGA